MKDRFNYLFGSTRGLILVAIAMTIGVYGFVALIVKLDDIGLHLMARSQRCARAIGWALLAGVAAGLILRWQPKVGRKVKAAAEVR